MVRFICMTSKQTVRNHLVVASPVGKLRLVASDKGLIAIDVRNNAKEVVTVKDSSAQAILLKTKKQLEQYFAGKRTSFDIALDLVGTEFQVQAWRALCRIPFGKTISYGQQASNIKKPKAFRAVGSANGKNPIPIIVPCHRVVASDGSLGGYSLGLKMKKQLLALEGVSEAE
jgi:methylated-DNA-[protein]-cysteine S-methyltransferase